MNAKSLAIVAAMFLSASSSALAQSYPYSPYGWPYRHPYYAGPYYGATAYGSYLHGWADLERAWGEREINYWQSREIAEQVREHRLNTWFSFQYQARELQAWKRQQREDRMRAKNMARLDKLEDLHTATLLEAQGLVDQVQAGAQQWPAALERREIRPLVAQVEDVLRQWPSDSNVATAGERQALKDLARRLREVIATKNPYRLKFAERMLAMDTVKQLEALAAGDDAPGIAKAAAKAGLPGVG